MEERVQMLTKELQVQKTKGPTTIRESTTSIFVEVTIHGKNRSHATHQYVQGNDDDTGTVRITNFSSFLHNFGRTGKAMI